jgi:hypothetical protein
VERSLREDECVVGQWHSHPAKLGPSKTDLKTWAGEARFLDGRSFRGPLLCGLIAYQNGASWAYPAFRAFLSSGEECRAEEVDLLEERWRQ